MSTSFKNEVIVPTYLMSELARIESFTVGQTQNSSDALNNLDRQRRSFSCDDDGQQNCAMQLPRTNDGKACSLRKIDVIEKSPATNTCKFQSGAFRPKENFKRKRGRAVESVSEWIFPPGTKNKHDFIASSLRLGVDPNLNFQEHEKHCTAPSPSSRTNRVAVNRKRRLHEIDGSSGTMVHPVVTGVEFDSRFLTYKLCPFGEKYLVRSLSLLSIPIRNCSQAKEAWEKGYIEQIPDEPSRSETSSRIGPRYQAQIPSKLIDGKGADTVDSLFPGYSKLWDPKLAEEAERRGEDISGFLAGDHELCKKDLLYSILHKNNYSVQAARMDLENMQRQRNAFVSSKLNEDEARLFEKLIQKSEKDFSSVAKVLKRNRSDCLIHYYKWKRSSRRYQSMKKRWNDNNFSVHGEVRSKGQSSSSESEFEVESISSV